MARRYHDIRQELVDAIVSGEYGEGTWLPSEPELSERFGASRGVLREALRGLEDRGLLAARAGRGHVVCQREEWDVRSADVLRAAIARGPEPGLLADAVAARAVVERAAAEMAAAAATAADLDLLAARVADMDDALAPGVPRTFGADDPLVDAEIWFHRTLGALGGNAVLAKLVEPLHAPLAELRRVRAPDRDRAVVRRHQAILEGVSSREPPLAAGAVSAYARSLARWLGAGR
jgi:DNA-binding FadR family transcriptional regulator